MASCQCGCGHEAGIGAQNRPRKYVNDAHRNADRARLVAESRAAAEAAITIDIESFSIAIMTIKETKGLTWRQMSQLSGRTISHISSLGKPKNKKQRIRRDTAEDILRRLNGEHLQPTPYQVRQYDERLKKLQREQRSETVKNKKNEERSAKLEQLSLRLGTGSDQSS